MSELVLVTGGTGLAGSNIALLALKRGKRVRALVRNAAGTQPLKEAGVEVVEGDVTDPASLDRALTGVTGVIHAAAALGGTWSKFQKEDFWSVNHDGTLNVLDAAARAGVTRTVMIDTQSIVDPSFTHTERSPTILMNDVDSPYVRSKRAAFYGAMHRAARGQDIRTVTPGAIYGPGVFVERALDPTSFTSVALRALKGEIKEYVKFPLQWTYVVDLAEICVRALDQGQIGRRYLAMGSSDDVSSVGAFCNQVAEMAGASHRVHEIDPNDPHGPDIGTMRQFATRKWAQPYIDCSATTQALGYAPTPRAVAIRATLDWLAQEGKI